MFRLLFSKILNIFKTARISTVALSRGSRFSAGCDYLYPYWCAPSHR
jgi:hypothetical protein